MAEKTPARPPRLVTTCVYLALIGSYYLVQAIVVLTGWYGAGEEQVKRFTDPLVEGGLARGDAETVFRVYLAILAMLAGASVVFAVYTALGHGASRILLTITAPLMALVGLGQGSFFAIVVSVIAFTCTFQLWSSEVRRWFDLLAGKEPRPQPAAAAPTTWPPPLPSDPAGTQQQATQWQGHPQAYAQGYPPRPPARRDGVKILAVIALIGSTLIALGCAVYLLMYEFAREELVREQLDSGMNWMNLTEAEIRDSMADLAVVSWVGLVLCLVAAAVSTVLLVRRRRRRG